FGEFLEPRQDLMRRRTNSDGNASGLEVLKFGSHIVVVVLVEGDGAGGGERKPGGAVLGCLRCDLVGWAHLQMHILQVQVRRLELLHEVDEVGGIELAEGIAGYAEV